MKDKINELITTLLADPKVKSFTIKGAAGIAYYTQVNKDGSETQTIINTVPTVIKSDIVGNFSHLPGKLKMQKMLSLSNEGLLQSDIALLMGCTQSHVSHMIKKARALKED